jgi:hypothetical protein
VFSGFRKPVIIDGTSGSRKLLTALAALGKITRTSGISGFQQNIFFFVKNHKGDVVFFNFQACFNLELTCWQG